MDEPEAPDAVLIPRGDRYELAISASPTHPQLYPDSCDDPRLLAILDAIMQGEVGFRQACVDQGFKPTAVRQWAVRDTPEGFQALYREARRIEMDAFSDEILTTADAKDRGEDRDTAGAVYRDQLSIKTKQWLMSRRAPAEFGDRGTVDEKGQAVVKKQVIFVAGRAIEF